jgi:hypothetical protein
MHWAEPDEDHLVQLMRHVYENREEAKERGRKAAKMVRRKLSMEAAAQILIDYLDSKF